LFVCRHPSLDFRGQFFGQKKTTDKALESLFSFQIFGPKKFFAKIAIKFLGQKVLSKVRWGTANKQFFKASLITNLLNVDTNKKLQALI